MIKNKDKIVSRVCKKMKTEEQSEGKVFAEVNIFVPRETKILCDLLCYRK